MLRYALLLLLLAVSGVYDTLLAQNTVFISQGKIEYERSVNVYAQINNDQSDNDNNGFADLQKKMSSHFKTDYFDLLFSRGKSLYRPGRESNDKDNSFFLKPPAQDNTVFCDLDNEKSTSQKNVFDQLFLVQDSLRKIKWKITTETRTIAGFSCRRANAIIMDSVYVVAFYTDEILTSGGPESFTGLPGMILGVALPHQHISWFATRVEAVNVSDTQLTPPAKGKKTDNETLLKTIKESLKDWGKEGQHYMQSALL
jgi:GLPGLI family protein